MATTPDPCEPPPSSEAERRRKADITRPSGASRPLSVAQERQAWEDSIEADFRHGNNDAGLLLWCIHGRFEAISVWEPVIQELAVGLALHEHHAGLARSIDEAIGIYNDRGLPLPMPFRRYRRDRPSAWPRGRSPWGHFDRNVALAREAFQWRLTRQDDFNWQYRHAGLAKPSACIDWTRFSLTATLDTIEAEEWRRPWNATESGFDASNAWRCAYQEPSLDENRLLARGGMYLEHFRALLVDHVATLCMSEWQCRLDARP